MGCAPLPTSGSPIDHKRRPRLRLCGLCMPHIPLPFFPLVLKFSLLSSPQSQLEGCLLLCSPARVPCSSQAHFFFHVHCPHSRRVLDTRLIAQCCANFSQCFASIGAQDPYNKNIAVDLPANCNSDCATKRTKERKGGGARYCRKWRKMRLESLNAHLLAIGKQDRGHHERSGCCRSIKPRGCSKRRPAPLPDTW